MAMIAERYTDYMYGLIDKVMKEIGPRESCSEEEKRLGRLFAEEIAPACERVETETFTCSPTAFMGFFPWLVLMYLAGAVLYFFIPAISAALALTGGLILFFEVVRYKELIDPLCQKKDGENVVGTVAPRGEPVKRVYVSAHFDSAYEFKLWYWFKSFSTVYMGIGFLAILAMLGFSVASSIAKPVGLPGSTVYWVFGFILVGLAPVVSLFAFFHTDDVVPGAMDDMAGIAVLAGLAKYFEAARESGDFYPERTEVVLLGLSSEEAGLRGAKRFASAHAGEAEKLPAQGIFLDGIYDERFFTVFKKEVWPGGKMDPYLVDLARESSEAVGFGARVGVLPLGATDATAFALEGIPSVSICLWESTKLVPHYHTRHDTIEHIRPISLAVALQATIEMLERIDSP
ncbi:MAG: M28 family metallopeptidase [Candidatus Geothermincolia bacterium]